VRRGWRFRTFVTGRADFVRIWSRLKTPGRRVPRGCRVKPALIGTSPDLEEAGAGRNGNCETRRVMRRRIGEWLLSAGVVALLLVAILVIYDPVREDVSRRVLTRPSAELSTVVQRTRNQAEHVAAAAREQFRTHSELAVFAIAAAVLFGFMLRT
jgi:hypothetical protein